eukprot:TRINITY_DN3340_c0_g1_i1.p1 TRINITY_DN3340_c0_g1~~TRINITY_DN3340_c0_g1_i1.p1  ORF type:complete len:114 (-),score=7.71 TRINITY_DN3340_c0_g1_i1:707-1048(-)
MVVQQQNITLWGCCTSKERGVVIRANDLSAEIWLYFSQMKGKAAYKKGQRIGHTLNEPQVFEMEKRHCRNERQASCLFTYRGTTDSPPNGPLLIPLNPPSLADQNSRLVKRRG